VYLMPGTGREIAAGEAVEERRRERMTPGQRAALADLEAFEREQIDALKRMPVPEDRAGIANLGAGISYGGQPNEAA
jgi:hypothetical protein